MNLLFVVQGFGALNQIMASGHLQGLICNTYHFRSVKPRFCLWHVGWGIDVDDFAFIPGGNGVGYYGVAGDYFGCLLLFEGVVNCLCDYCYRPEFGVDLWGGLMRMR